MLLPVTYVNKTTQKIFIPILNSIGQSKYLAASALHYSNTCFQNPKNGGNFKQNWTRNLNDKKLLLVGTRSKERARRVE